ncbi:exonuclease domain-containing protein [Isoptericola aurantiacus]|uniref:exonuclease domain-containing protein n=1 Tax=Isoptericola aurantiacus TaxID=3377839 RepID=UPI00383AE96F
MGILGRLFGTRRTARPEAPNPQPVDKNPADKKPAEAAYSVIDVETTGLSPRQDRILELAVVRLDHEGSVIDEWSTRFNPEGPVGATHIHGITDGDVASAPLFREQSRDVALLLGGSTVVAHNARFDLAFLRAEYLRSGWELPFLPAYCTLQGSHHYLPHLERRRLADCCAAADVRLTDAHSALGDARATGRLMNRYLTMPRVPVHAELDRARIDTRAFTWPEGPSRAPLTTLPGGAGAPRNRPRRVTPPRPKQAPLVQQLTALGLTELLDDGAPAGTTPYLELLLEVLEDGVVSASEAGALADLIEVYGLAPDEVAAAHQAFVTALAHRALDDGHVSRDERSELSTIAELLQVQPATVRRLIGHADEARAARLSAGLGPLPVDWSHGEPLRVGDKVVFTGCDDAQRARLEQRAEELGVRVMSSVSRTTAMLVTDGSFSGGKAAKAADLGLRTVHPDHFEILLAHLQPAASAVEASPVPPAAAEAPLRATPQPASAGSTAPHPAAVRRWARENGHEVSSRGRLPRAVVEAYERAQHGEG